MELSLVEPVSAAPGLDVLALYEALEKLAAREPHAARLVQLRFFADLSTEKAAKVLGVDVTTGKTY